MFHNINNKYNSLLNACKIYTKYTHTDLNNLILLIIDMLLFCYIPQSLEDKINTSKQITLPSDVGQSNKKCLKFL